MSAKIFSDAEIAAAERWPKGKETWAWFDDAYKNEDGTECNNDPQYRTDGIEHG